MTQVFVMHRYLVVANQTLQAAELREELRNRISAGPCSFFVLVPDTRAAQYDAAAAGGVLRQPGMCSVAISTRVSKDAAEIRGLVRRW